MSSIELHEKSSGDIARPGQSDNGGNNHDSGEKMTDEFDGGDKTTRYGDLSPEDRKANREAIGRMEVGRKYTVQTEFTAPIELPADRAGERVTIAVGAPVIYQGFGSHEGKHLFEIPDPANAEAKITVGVFLTSPEKK